MATPAREFTHSMKRRCFAHDYKGRSIYLITLEVAGRRPLLGRIVTGLRLTHRTEAAQIAGQIGAAQGEGRLIGGAQIAGQIDGAQIAGRLTGGAAARGLETPLAVSGLGESALKAVNAPLFEPSELGRRVAEEFMKISEHVPGVKPLLAQAMPDHFHGILFVTREIGRSLGSIMAGFKGKCSQVALALTRGAPNRYGLTAGAPDLQGLTPRAPNRSGAPRVSASALGGHCGPLWEPGYHDRILTSEGQLEKMIRYVIDNPRRAALRLAHRELFTGVRRLTANGRVFEAYGNGFLLQRAEIAQVQCSRRFFAFRREEKRGRPLALTRGAPNPRGLAAGAAKRYRVTRETAFETPEFAAKKAALFEVAKNGAVLCSPCVSDGEKAIAYAAVDAGYPLIVLRNEPFPPRFKPSGRFFDACAEGRLLMLRPLALTAGAPNPQRWATGAPSRFGTPAVRPQRFGALRVSASALGGGRQPARITRAECLALNAIVAEICGGDAGDIAYQGFTPTESTAFDRKVN